MRRSREPIEVQTSEVLETSEISAVPFTRNAKPSFASNRCRVFAECVSLPPAEFTQAQPHAQASRTGPSPARPAWSARPSLAPQFGQRLWALLESRADVRDV